MKYCHYLFLVLLAATWGRQATWAEETKSFHGTDKTPAKTEEKLESFDVPYRLTKTKHVLIRAKLNGNGPFNFILDTGAPAVFIPKKVAEELKLKLDRSGWGTFDSFILEGGLKVPEAQTLVEDLFQLEGMNSMGLAGVELHGVIGYNVLAKYRITYDFTKSKLRFQPLKFAPPSIERVRGGGQGSLDMLGTLMKVLTGFLGAKPNFDIQPTGFIGVQWKMESGKGVLIHEVMAGGPAALAGLQSGDQIDQLGTVSIDDLRDVEKALRKTKPGEKLTIKVRRDGKTLSYTVTTLQGF